METIGRSPRRGFIDRIAGAVAAFAAAPAVMPEVVAAQPASDAGWIAEVRGKSRCFFDCPQHANGMGLLQQSTGNVYMITGLVLLVAASVDAISRRQAAASGRA